MLTATPHGNPSWARTLTIGDLDGALDKRDSETEGQHSYAASYYRQLRDELKGTAYARNTTGLLHCENIAAARFWAGLMRAADRQQNNTLPLTADEKLEEWVEILALPIKPSDSRADIRTRCASHYRLLDGPRRQAIDDAVAETLGNLYIKTWRITGTSLSSPPDGTYWPTANPGPSTHDLGGGAWLSPRCHVVFEVEYPEKAPSLVDYLDRVNTDLYRLFRRLLPSFVTFNWGCNVEGGFVFDVDRWDFGSVTDP